MAAHVVEECGEVLQAIGKVYRFGLFSWNPVIPGRSNIDTLKRELTDLRNAIDRLEERLNEVSRESEER